MGIYNFTVFSTVNRVMVFCLPSQDSYNHQGQPIENLKHNQNPKHPNNDAVFTGKERNQARKPV
jgi:hypothetical protein